ncbi:MAG: DUF547 domain-containing protein [Chitinophagaceae bacterium]
MNAIVASSDKNITLPNTDLIALSQQLLLAAKTKEPTDSLTAILSTIPETEISKQLSTEDQKKAFWINIYNAYTQIILSKEPGKYKSKSSFFSRKQIAIAGHFLSLDNIEHGILRHSKIKWSLGYLNTFFPSAFERKNRAQAVDYRIHFSLNCGAKSCPPIAFYKPEQLDKQLDQATKVYLQGESDYNEKENTVSVPALMGWFRHDFGGRKEMKRLLKKLSVIPAGKNPSIHFKAYDWNLFLENYNNE